jgi:NRPS condensation-like uncharacterized protein
MVEILRGELAEAIMSGIAGDHPHMHLHVVLDLRRAFDREALDDAARAVQRAFPVLGSRHERRWWRDRWVALDEDPARRVHHDAIAEDELQRATEAWVARELDVETEAPWRALALTHDAGCRLIVTVHHFVGDGAGALAVANVFLAQLFEQPPRAPAGTDRSLGQIFRGLGLRDLPTVLAELWREAFKPAALIGTAPVRFAGGSGTGAPRWRTLSFDVGETERFASACRQQDATVNDGLVATLARVKRGEGAGARVGVAYTIDTRRYLPEPVNVVTNLPAVELVALDADDLEHPATAIRAAARCTASQKRRLPGIAYNLLPFLTLWWMPHGAMRRVGALFIERLLGFVGRVMVLTNLGSLDDHLAPAGEDLLGAHVVGPFVGRVDVPVVTATGFRGTLTLAVGANGRLATSALEDHTLAVRSALVEAGVDR